MMPYHRCGTVAQRPSSLLQPPTHVHIVPRRPELRIKTSDRLQTPFAKRHVAARDMFGLPVRQQHVRRSPGRVRHALRYRPVAGRRQVRTAHRRLRRVHGVQKRRRQIVQPMPVRVGVVVDIRHDLPAGHLQARVARAAQSAIVRAYHLAVVLPRDDRRAIARSVIDHDHFVIGILQLFQRPQTIADRSRPVVSTHHHRHPRPGHLPPKGHFPKGPPHRPQGRLGPPRPVRYPKLPVLYLRPAPIPFIGPGIHKDPGAPVGKHRPDLPVEHLRLLALPVATTVQTQLRHHQRPAPGQVVQARQIRIQTFVRFQIHIERQKIQKRQLQIFRRGIIDIRHQALGILRLCPSIEPLQKPFQLAPSVPPHDRGRDLVADCVTEQRRVARQRPHLPAHHLLD